MALGGGSLRPVEDAEEIGHVALETLVRLTPLWIK
jgi:hypothetical protein